MYYKNQIQISLLICWILTLFSVNSNFLQLNEIYKYKTLSIENILNLFNYLRFYFPYIIIIFLLSLFILLKKKFNLFIVLFFTYFLYQLVLDIILNTQINGKLNLELWEKVKNFQLLINAISVLLIFNIALSLNLRNFFKKLFIILFMFITIISVFFSTRLLNEFIQSDNLFYFYTSTTLQPEHLTLQQANPRVTGLSRMILLIFFLLYFVNLSLSKIKFINHFTYISLFICSFFIYLMQSRGAWIGIFIIFFLHIYYNKNLKKFFIVLAIVLISIFFAELVLNIKKKTLKETDNIESIKKINSLKEKQQRLITNYTTSGRTEIWGNIIIIIKEKKIIYGKGSQSDRYLLTKFINENKIQKKFTVFENNASNTILYSYLCAGFIGLTIFLFIYINAASLLYKNITHNKIFFGKDIIVNFSITTLIYLLVRSIYENSFSLFGIDFVFFLLSYFIIYKKKITKK